MRVNFNSTYSHRPADIEYKRANQHGAFQLPRRCSSYQSSDPSTDTSSTHHRQALRTPTRTYFAQANIIHRRAGGFMGSVRPLGGQLTLAFCRTNRTRTYIVLTFGRAQSPTTSVFVVTRRLRVEPSIYHYFHHQQVVESPICSNDAPSNPHRPPARTPTIVVAFCSNMNEYIVGADRSVPDSQWTTTSSTETVV